MNGHEAATYFRDLADRIERNPPEEFGGAFFLMPPGDAPGVDIVLMSRDPNEATFWAMVAGQSELALASFRQSAEAYAPPGPRGRQAFGGIPGSR